MRKSTVLNLLPQLVFPAPNVKYKASSQPRTPKCITGKGSDYKE
jgi:hypothetical protein